MMQLKPDQSLLSEQLAVTYKSYLVTLVAHLLLHVALRWPSLKAATEVQANALICKLANTCAALLARRTTLLLSLTPMALATLTRSNQGADAVQLLRPIRCKSQ
jgi:hypothetical protein